MLNICWEICIWDLYLTGSGNRLGLRRAPPIGKRLGVKGMLDVSRSSVNPLLKGLWYHGGKRRGAGLSTYYLVAWDNSLWVVPMGNSGHPGSPHYCDQSETWRKVEMVPMLYSWGRIIAESETQQRLEPG